MKAGSERNVCKPGDGHGRVLLIGYGNPGRGDDGLGPALAEAIEKLHLPGVTVEADYQLTVEDAAAAAEHELVIFADADLAGAEPFSFRPVEPVFDTGFSTHSVRPGQVLALAGELFGARPAGFLLGIRGYVFEPFRETLTKPAEANLALAVRFTEQLLRGNIRLEDALACPRAGEADAVAPSMR